MPAPELYGDGEVDPFVDDTLLSAEALPRILYATDRAPAPADRKGGEAYTGERGYALRLGSASIELGLDESITWEEARRISLLKNRTLEYPMQVGEVREFGPLARTVITLDPGETPSDGPGREFAEAVNAKLDATRTRDVLIYVHGYKVTFENPLLVASELWHFLGYDGVFVAYSWPATPKSLAYVSDLEDALLSARNLRKFIHFLSEETQAERIHVIGYSAGTRLVSRMLADFGMYTRLVDAQVVRDELRIGHVILTGSDVDRDIFGGYLMDGALRVPEALIVYQSTEDKALGMSRFVFGRNRVGQFFDADDPAREKFLSANPQLQLINVTEARGARGGTGHGYFRSSPWVSSDVLVSLLYGAAPSARGLVQIEGSRVWAFPEDYPARLREALGALNPALSAAVDGFQAH
jgi:esterase/lipase superfamily enzyme